MKKIKIIKKIRHKWHSYWFKKHWNFLIGEYRTDVYNIIDEAFNDVFKWVSLEAITDTTSEEPVEDFVSAVGGTTKEAIKNGYNKIHNIKI